MPPTVIAPAGGYVPAKATRAEPNSPSETERVRSPNVIVRPQKRVVLRFVGKTRAVFYTGPVPGTTKANKLRFITLARAGLYAVCMRLELINS